MLDRKLIKTLHQGGYLSGNPQFEYVSGDPWLYPVGFDYFLDREEAYTPRKDTTGLPVKYYDPDGNPHYTPTSIGSYGLARWNRWRERGDDASRDAFMLCANWFMQSTQGRFSYDFDLLDMHAPWISGIGQGQGMSLLVRAYHATGEEDFLRLAQRAFEPMLMPREKGGVAGTLDDGSFFIEEYPQRRPPHILNGFVYAVIGIADLDRASPSRITGETLAACWDTLAHHVYDWDLDGWSSYDLHNLNGSGPRNFATPAYHSVHVAMMRYAYAATGNTLFSQVADRWRERLKDPWARMQAFVGKVDYRWRHPNRMFRPFLTQGGPETP